MTAPSDIADDLAHWVATLDGDALPDDVRFAATTALLDTLGCALAGQSADGVVQIRRASMRWSGTEECSVWGTGVRLAPPDAAFVNGAAAHAREFDDTHDASVIHAGGAVCAAAVATAEAVGDVNGRQLVAAIVSGVDVGCRLAAAVRVGPGMSGWLLTPLVGYFGAAAAAAHVLQLDTTATRNAFGIAYSQAAGNGQATLDGGLTKRLQPGFAARGGLLSAWLAADGVTGAARVFEGQRGYFHVYHGSQYDRGAVLDDLGSRFSVGELGFKPYPCCRWTHAAIEAALALRERGVTCPDVSSIDVEVNDQALRSTGTPLEVRQRPRTPSQAQFSLPYVVAVALVRGAVELGDFGDEALADKEVLSLASRVCPREWQGQTVGSLRGISGARATVRTISGPTQVASKAHPMALRPLPEDRVRLVNKFVTCCAYAGVTGGAELAESVLAIEGERDVAAVFQWLEQRSS